MSESARESVAYLEVQLIRIVDLHAGALMGGEENITIEIVVLDEREPSVEQLTELLAMLQHQWQQLETMQLRDIADFRQQYILAVGQAVGQQLIGLIEDAPVARLFVVQIVDILLLRAHQLMQYVATALLGHVAAQAFLRAEAEAGAAAGVAVAAREAAAVGAAAGAAAAAAAGVLIVVAAAAAAGNVAHAPIVLGCELSVTKLSWLRRALFAQLFRAA